MSFFNFSIVGYKDTNSIHMANRAVDKKRVQPVFRRIIKGSIA